MSSTSSKNITCDRMHIFTYVLMILLFVLPHTIASNFNKTLEAKALADWLGRNASDHCTSYDGITCNVAGSVVSILYNCGQYYYNYFPRDLGNLDFSSFPNLERFIIDRCHLEGSIPEQIGMLSNLAHLSLRGTNLNGTLPVSITNLTKLVELDLSRNNFKSTIPSQIGNLKNLLHLDLSHNNFIGPIPSSLGSMVNLTYLDLRTNKLNGSIPQELSNLQKLEELNLGDNNLRGPILSSIGNLSALKLLNLGTNNISGIIPLDITNLMNLEHVDLNHNRLLGPVHPEFGKLSQLVYLDLSSNHLSGNVSFQTPCSLEHLVLSKNRMSGVVKTLKVCTKLYYLDISSNNFVGEALTDEDFFYHLKYLDQSENHLTTMVPTDPRIQNTALSNNEQRNKLVHLLAIFLPIIHPSSLFHGVNLTYLVLSITQFTGPIPSSLGSMFNLANLDLRTNKLNGSIPQELKHIDLSKNRMTGVVKTLKACTMLHYLDLSSNNFVGEALTDEDFFYLEFLNQSQNHFTTVRTPIQKSVHHLVIILPVIVGICFLFLGYVYYYRHKATNDKIQPETIKHGDVCAVLNFDGTIAYEDFN
ncbi:MDIS1-interacting receptor like kinase 2-like protein [Tanacetum coccineum]